MSVLDIVVVVVVTISIIFGIKRGLVKEVFTLLALILGVVIASRFYSYGAGWISGVLDNSNLANIVSFTVIFFVLVVLISLAGIFFNRMVKLVQLGWVDRMGGVVFGFLRGSVIVGVFLVFITKYPILGSERWVEGSNLAPFFLQFIESLWKLVPKELLTTISA